MVLRFFLGKMLSVLGGRNAANAQKIPVKCGIILVPHHGGDLGKRQLRSGANQHLCLRNAAISNVFL